MAGEMGNALKADGALGIAAGHGPSPPSRGKEGALL
jgi:hypothetical protein